MKAQDLEQDSLIDGIQICGKRCHFKGIPLKGHHANAITLLQFVKTQFHGANYLPQFALHAAGCIEKQNQIQGFVLKAEVDNGLGVAFVENAEIFLLEISQSQTGRIERFGIEAD